VWEIDSGGLQLAQQSRSIMWEMLYFSTWKIELGSLSQQWRSEGGGRGGICPGRQLLGGRQMGPQNIK